MNGVKLNRNKYLILINDKMRKIPEKIYQVFLIPLLEWYLGPWTKCLGASNYSHYVRAEAISFLLFLKNA